MATAIEQIKKYAEDIKKVELPEELKNGILLRLDQLSGLSQSPTFLPEFDRMNKYLEWVLALPWYKRTKDNLDLIHAREILDKNHYGLVEIKDRVLEYISVMKLKQEKGEGEDILRAPILCFVGLVGTGKTTIASSIAEAIGLTGPGVLHYFPSKIHLLQGVLEYRDQQDAEKYARLSDPSNRAMADIFKAIEELVQLNERQPFSYDRDELVKMLDAALGRKQ